MQFETNLILKLILFISRDCIWFLVLHFVTSLSLSLPFGCRDHLQRTASMTRPRSSSSAAERAKMLPTSAVMSHLYLPSSDSDHRCWLSRPPTRLRLAQPATPKHRDRDSTLQFRSVPAPRDRARVISGYALSGKCR